MATINNDVQNTIYSVLGIDSLNTVEKNQVMSALGESVLENALLRFSLTLDEWSQSSFEQWVEKHADSKDLIEQAVTLYPVFGNILTEEILLIKNSFEKSE